jgi:hypothetical protein
MGDVDTMGSPAAGSMTTGIAIKTARIVRIRAMFLNYQTIPVRRQPASRTGGGQLRLGRAAVYAEAHTPAADMIMTKIRMRVSLREVSVLRRPPRAEAAPA